MNKILLYLSSYVPLYLILIVKNVILKLELINWNMKSIIFFNSVDDYVLVILAVLTIVSLIYIKISLKSIKKFHKNRYVITRINHASSDSILNYISIYILTFIDFDLNSISNIITLMFIMILLGIIAIKYDDLYINPTLLFWNYKIYSISIDKNGKEMDKIVLIKGNVYKNTELEIYESSKQYTFAEIYENEI